MNTLKTLHPTTILEEYEALYLFWLGIDLGSIDEKQELEQRKLIETKVMAHLKKDYSLSEITQALLILQTNIEAIKQKKLKFNEDVNYELDLANLNDIKLKLTKLSTELGQLEFRKELIHESKSDLENETSNINLQKIRQLYAEAKILVPNVQKSFEETVKFHNEMISEKIKYIEQELPELELLIIQIKKRLMLYYH